ncbi:hypothetical protein BDB00DRAFT_162901 [Zychaea mexicana]|uniref:uncharacterized protein n=1 Tax=Zychaea mexicana TaxID=64656 RepID=UPI0022FDD79E|nr:uncharacterized protein BDB00DRAFT_162901 [Zychaea mexicana]KAI9496101.1 hypothetical protein BDB00DRAFT_162901 [Zychaea mexicana]
MASAPATRFKIQLESQSIILCGTPEQSTGRLLRGNLMLHLRAPIRVKSIKMRLFGQMKLQWHDTSKKRTVIDHEWVFLEPSKQGPHIIEAGAHTYPFELQLPGDLPETIEDSSYGQVSYKLKAIAVRPALASNLIDREVLHIYRQPTMMDRADLDDARSVRVSGYHEDIMTYELECRQRIFRRGDRIPAKIHLWPNDNNDDDCFNNKITETRILRFARDEHFPSLNTQHCSKSMPIPVPRYAKYDTSNSLLNIVHQLHFTISLVNNTDGRLTELRAALPISVAQDELVEALRLADGDLLPSYEDARRSAPYIPDMTMQIDSPPNTPTDELDDWLSTPRINTDNDNGSMNSNSELPSLCDSPPLYYSPLPSYETIMALPANRTLIR